jgi:hypothetical protein
VTTSGDDARMELVPVRRLEVFTGAGTAADLVGGGQAVDRGGATQRVLVATKPVDFRKGMGRLGTGEGTAPS